jgi:hypothetical protein
LNPPTGYYLFVEYDGVVQCPLEQFVARAASRGVDLVALPITRTSRVWHWMPYQRNVYPAGEVKLALLDGCLFSFLVSNLLHQRPRVDEAAPSMRLWPGSEVVWAQRGGAGGHDLAIPGRLWRRFSLRLVPDDDGRRFATSRWGCLPPPDA